MELVVDLEVNVDFYFYFYLMNFGIYCEIMIFE